jgi:hypothetical protein
MPGCICSESQNQIGANHSWPCVISRDLGTCIVTSFQTCVLESIYRSSTTRFSNNIVTTALLARDLIIHAIDQFLTVYTYLHKTSQS